MAESATTALQEQIIETVKTTQDAYVSFVESWAKTVSGSPVPFASPDPEGYLRFAQTLWDLQRRSAIGVLQALEPVATAQTKARGNAAAGRASSSSS